MESHELVETGSLCEETNVKDGSAQPEAVKLIEMGDVSVETQGIARGLELGFTPRNI